MPRPVALARGQILAAGINWNPKANSFDQILGQIATHLDQVVREQMPDLELKS